jgi:hypothetical protein
MTVGCIGVGKMNGLLGYCDTEFVTKAFPKAIAR